MRDLCTSSGRDASQNRGRAWAACACAVRVGKQGRAPQLDGRTDWVDDATAAVNDRLNHGAGREARAHARRTRRLELAWGGTRLCYPRRVTTCLPPTAYYLPSAQPLTIGQHRGAASVYGRCPRIILDEEEAACNPARRTVEQDHVVGRQVEGAVRVAEGEQGGRLAVGLGVYSRKRK